MYQKAGIKKSLFRQRPERNPGKESLDSRFRGNDGAAKRALMALR
jgi:hypothetical protein